MYSDRILLTIHGVTSDNSGLANLCENCKMQLPGLITDSHYYHSLVPFKDLTKPTRDLVFRDVQDKIELVWYRHINGNGKKLFIVAHSFGTLAIIRALQMHIPNVTIEGLILLSSIIPRAQVWDGFVRSKQLQHPPLTIIRPLDFVLRLADHVGGEPSGAQGFIATGQYRPYETYKDGGHAAYYPDDVQDVIVALKSGVAAVPLTSHTQWRTKCGWFKRLQERWLMA